MSPLPRSGLLLRPLEGAGLVAAAPPVPVRTILRRFWPDARPYRPQLALGLLFLAVVPAVEAAEVWLFKVLVDTVLVPGDLGALPWLAAAAVALAAVGGLVSFADDVLAAWIGERFLLDLRARLYGHLQSLSPDDLDRRRGGDLVARLTSDVQAIESFVLTGVASAVSALVRLLLFGSLLVWLSWELALVAFLATPVFLLVARRFSRAIRHASREKRRRNGALAAVAEEGLGNQELVQAFGREEAELARFRRENDGMLRAELAATRHRALFGTVVDLIELAGGLLVVAWGAWAVSEGRLTVGGVLAFLAYLALLYAPVQELGRLGTTVFAAAASAERVLELLDAAPAVRDRPGARRLARPVGVVELDDVTFGYAGRGGPALVGVDLRVEPGETLALVGASGAGKSTVARLLLRFHDPQAGAVRLDGHDLRDLTLECVRGAIAYLPQEAPLLNGTVRENLLVARPDATDAELVAAAVAAGADQFVRELQDGYETVVGERGRLLSGGQRQRLAIARALLRDAPVLVLDEPTTGLDAAAATALREPLRRLAAGRATIVVSHDPHAVRDASRIAVLAGGRLVETGTHDELVALGGRYAQTAAA